MTTQLRLASNKLFACFASVILFFGYFQLSVAQHCTPSYSVNITGNSATFQDQSSADGTITGYNWTFGDGETSTEQNPTYTYAHAGVYEVCLTIFAHNPDCHATFCHHINIEAHSDTCHAGYSVHQPDPHFLSFDFTDLSQGSSSIISWNWDFGDGSTSSDQNPSHVFESPGTYLVCLFIEDADGCSSHYCHELIVPHPVEDHCQAGFDIHHIDQEHLSVIFSDNSTSDGHVVEWLWDFGDGSSSTDQNPTHVYEAAGTYTVCLFITDSNGCSSHFCHEVTLHHEAHHCDAFFTFHRPHQDHYTVNFTDNSASDTGIHSWYWDFGDGSFSSEQNPSHAYDHPGTYLVCLFISDADSSCVSHFCHHVVIHQATMDDHNDHVAQRRVNSNSDFVVIPKDQPEAEMIEKAAINRLIATDAASNEFNNFVHQSPNPFNETVSIQFYIEQEASVRVFIYNMTGNLVFNSVQNLPKGYFNKEINVDNLLEGIYIMKVDINGESWIRKIVKAK